MSSDPGRLSERFFMACLFVLLGSLALAAALEVLERIWVPLAIGGGVGVTGWLWLRQQRRY